MTLAIYSTIVSPHVLPFVEEVQRQYPGLEVKYITRGFAGLRPTEKIKIKKGWDKFDKLPYAIRAQDDWDLTWKILRECDILLCSFRETDLFEERVKAGRLTYYNGERWMKPYELTKNEVLPGWVRTCLRLPGVFRLLVPSYFRMVRRFIRLMTNEKFVFLPIGIHAARDIVRFRRILSGQLKYLFCSPCLEIEKRILAPIDGCNQARLWGYFVSPSQAAQAPRPLHDPLKLLFVGRMMPCKRIDAMIAAVKGDARYALTLLGDGELKGELHRMASGCENIEFREPTDLDGVRQAMRDHDALILGSDSIEGWGAVASEAIAEGLRVIGSYEAGSTATMLPEGNLYHAGDVAGLRRVLQGEIRLVDSQAWSAEHAAAEFIKDWSARNGE